MGNRFRRNLPFSRLILFWITYLSYYIGRSKRSQIKRALNVLRVVISELRINKRALLPFKMVHLQIHYFWVDFIIDIGICFIYVYLCLCVCVCVRGHACIYSVFDLVSLFFNVELLLFCRRNSIQFNVSASTSHLAFVLSVRFVSCLFSTLV